MLRRWYMRANDFTAGNGVTFLVAKCSLWRVASVCFPFLVLGEAPTVHHNVCVLLASQCKCGLLVREDRVEGLSLLFLFPAAVLDTSHLAGISHVSISTLSRLSCTTSLPCDTLPAQRVIHNDLPSSDVLQTWELSIDQIVPVSDRFLKKYGPTPATNIAWR